MDELTNRRGFLAKSAFAAGAIGLGSHFPTEEASAAPALVTSVNAREFGAIGDGKQDDTEALRKAFKSVSPGTAVNLSRGQYVLSGSVNIPPACSLMGEPFGTQLIAKHYDAPVLRMSGETRASDIAIIYPDNGDLKNPKESPESISLIGNGAGYIDNITFVNAFIGVGTPIEGANCGQTVIRKLNGFVHDTMVRIDGSLDIVRIENVHCFVAMGESEPEKSYYRKHRKCFHIKGSDGTLISKSFMIFGGIFLLKEHGHHGAGLSTYLSQCWLEGMSQHGILLNDGSRMSLVGVELACAHAKSVIEVNNGGYLRANSCYIRDSFHTKGFVINEGSGVMISDCEFAGSPGFTGIELNSTGHSIISGNFLHHCEVGIHGTPEADNYIITGNQLSGNNQPTVLEGGTKTIVKDNL